MSWGYQWRPYVSVAQKLAQARAYAKRLAKKQKREPSPIEIEGRDIARTFWGEAWCDNLEQYSDFENRLPRGRTYVRNGSVVDLQIERGNVKAVVGGSEVYEVRVSITTLHPAAWKRVKKDCSQAIDSLIDLLQGKFDQGVMKRLTHPEHGLFPRPKEIKMSCTCPDWAGLCKHVAAVLYGVAARLDSAPELLFTLRGVDHFELISQAATAENLDNSLGTRGDNRLAGSNLDEIFGIELDQGAEKPTVAKKKKGSTFVARGQGEFAKNGRRKIAKPEPNRTARRAAAGKKVAAANKRSPAKRKRMPQTV